MLPSIFQNSEDLINSSVEVERKQPVKTYKMDFETGEIYSVLIDDKEAIAQFIIKAIKTVRDRYLTYSSRYGSEIEYILGQNYSEEHFKLEFERLVNEALVDYDRFVKIIEIDFISFDGDTVEVELFIEIDTSEIISVGVTF